MNVFDESTSQKPIFVLSILALICKVPYKVAFEPARKCGSNERLLDTVALTVQKWQPYYNEAWNFQC